MSDLTKTDSASGTPPRRQCKAKSKGSGERCKRRPVAGADVCLAHGGGARQVKAKAAEVGVLMEKLRSTPGLDQRWISIGVTDLQKGFMFAVRGIAQPESF